MSKECEVCKSYTSLTDLFDWYDPDTSAHEDHSYELINLCPDCKTYLESKNNFFRLPKEEGYTDLRDDPPQNVLEFKKNISSARIFIRIAQSLLEENNQLVELLQKALRAEYQQWDLYYAYKDELKGLPRDSVSNHFNEHAQDEAEHIETLQRYLVSMGIQPTKQREPIPEIDYSSMESIIALQLKFEKDAVETYQQILSVVEDRDPLRIEIENILAKEQEHAHDLERLLPKDVETFL